jgi:hypothetical protein
VSSILTGGSAATSLPADERFGDAGVAQWPAATSLQADERFGDAGVAQWPAATSLQADERFGDAGVAQLVEHQLPKLRVAGSSPVSRFAVEEQDWPRADAEARAGSEAGTRRECRADTRRPGSVAEPAEAGWWKCPLV